MKNMIYCNNYLTYCNNYLTYCNNYLIHFNNFNTTKINGYKTEP